DDAEERAKMACNEAIKQAKIIYEQAMKLAVDDQTRKETIKAYEEVVKHAEEIRHKIEWEAQVASWASRRRRSSASSPAPPTRRAS
ncbi:MAG: hypothetical protein LAN84_17910, partial [Acidobacteriia bacterium]|nr:hypothetical protein [Terriglobia bacterium]